MIGNILSKIRSADGCSGCIYKHRQLSLSGSSNLFFLVIREKQVAKIIEALNTGPRV